MTQASSGLAEPGEIVAFWRAAGPDRWFTKDEAFDREIATRFLATHESAASGALASWEATPEGALALLLLLDQFPRNMFRGSKRAFGTDPLAHAVAERALARGYDSQVPASERQFFFLPLVHSESLADQERAIALYDSSGDAHGGKWARLHADIIRRFGRFPHRNAVLGRTTTAAEQTFLDEGGFAG